MSDDDLGWRVEAACHAAWPTPAERRLDGWLLRSGGGNTRRLNALHPLRDGPRDPSPVLDEARQTLAAIGKPLCVRVPALAAGLDATLVDLGFGAPDGETLTLLAPLAAGPVPATVTLTPRATPRWQAARVALAGLDAAAATQLALTMPLVPAPSRWATVVLADAIVAAGFGVLVDDLLVLEAIATDPRHQRQGHGRALVTALMRWAAAAGAEAACLQVLATNTPAIALYRGLGFTRLLYRYHYRIAPAARTGS